VIAARAGCEVVRVLPTRGLSALGLKCRPKPTDGTQAQAFARLTGRKCKAEDHHEARAYGVALAGQTVATTKPGNVSGAEFEARWNMSNLASTERVDALLENTSGLRLTYKGLIL
jgi:hypothetical protein